VVTGADGVAVFDALHRRHKVTDAMLLYAFDLLEFDGKDLRPLPLSERKAKLRARAPATGAHGKQRGPYHGEEAVEFANMVEYGMTPLQALRSATAVGAENIRRSDRVGAIEKGKYADIIAVSGNPAVDVTEMERVKFVMKGGQVYRNDLKGSATVSQR
jgi:hypothetical protein